jgi:predicted cupin superfamily sugar epimerase
MTSTGLPKTVKELVELMGLIPHPEGGFFLETHRSGSVPMSSMGQTDLDGSAESDLVVMTDASRNKTRQDRRPDNDGRRNALTSIFWVPTTQSPMFFLAINLNLSDRVHYYQGGIPFEYMLVDRNEQNKFTLQRVILGPDIMNGHKLQVPVKGGTWKCGRLLLGESASDKAAAESKYGCNYCIIGEAVAPGFDFYDFSWVTAGDLKQSGCSADVRDKLMPFVNIEATSSQEVTVHDTETFYDET